MKNFKLIDMYGKPGYMNPMRNYTNKCKCGNKKCFKALFCRKCKDKKPGGSLTRYNKPELRKARRREQYRIKVVRSGREYKPYNIQVCLPLIKNI